jgi:hypothetical protein
VEPLPACKTKIFVPTSKATEEFCGITTELFEELVILINFPASLSVRVYDVVASSCISK